MSDKTEIVPVTLHSLELMERRCAELEESSERLVSANDIVFYGSLIPQLRAVLAVHEKLAGFLERVEALETSDRNDREMMAALQRDASETRRLSIASLERADVVASQLDAIMSELSNVSRKAEEQAKALHEEAGLRDR